VFILVPFEEGDDLIEDGNEAGDAFFGSVHLFSICQNSDFKPACLGPHPQPLS
jgi:hypothetical protein